jgi:hypothetical protein
MAPLPGENILLYVASTAHVISTSIMVERQREGHVFPV